MSLPGDPSDPASIKGWRKEIAALEKQKADLENSIKNKQRVLWGLEQNCPHEWTEPKYVGEHVEGYYIPSDRERGIEMGVDSRMGCHVPSKDIPKWERRCKRCDKVEVTTNVEKKEISVPRF
jgi:hypothetical protein